MNVMKCLWMKVGKGIHLYSYASIGIKGLQEVDATVRGTGGRNSKSKITNS